MVEVLVETLALYWNRLKWFILLQP